MKSSNASQPKPTFTHQMADEEKSMPLGVGDAPAEEHPLEAIAGAGQARKLRSGPLLIVVVVIIACGGLWFMRSLSHVAGAVGVKSDIEQAIDGFLNARDTKGNVKEPKKSDPNVLSVLSESYTNRQVPLDNVARNPFIFPGEGLSKAAPVVVPGENPEVAIARARQERQKEINEAAARFVVKSIIMSAQPIANISGTIVRLGDEIAPEGSDLTFKVSTITADTITLVCDDLALGMHVEVPISMHRDKK